MKRILSLLVIVLGIGMTSALAAPGDPLGGTHTGCAPEDTLGLKCSAKLAQSLGKFTAKVFVCHLTEAAHAFQSGAQNGFSNAEANCEDGPSNTSATAKFDVVMAKLTALGCPAAPIAAATSRRDTLSAAPPGVGSLNTLNASFFCEGSLPIDEDGDPAGVIPTSAGSFECEVGVAKAYRKLVVTTHKCHIKLAAYLFKGADTSTFATECETGAAPVYKSALARYDAYVQKLIATGICPQCIVDNASALGTQAVADLDAQTNEIYPCPAP